MLNCSEVWKPVDEFPDRYEVSDMGNIRSIRTNHGAPCCRPLAVKLMNSGYRFVTLTNGTGKHFNRSVHRLVAKAFVCNPEAKPIVNHVDGDKLNNSASNLEWVTHSENHAHAWANGFREPQRTALLSRVTGSKRGESASTYHNVSYDSVRGKWKAALKQNGQVLFQKRFDNEEEAARYVDTMLDELGVTDRPRNFAT